MMQLQKAINTEDQELAEIRSAISDTVIRRDRLKEAMERWYVSNPGKRFPQVIELLSLDEKLSWLDSRFKNLWDARPGCEAVL